MIGGKVGDDVEIMKKRLSLLIAFVAARSSSNLSSVCCLIPRSPFLSLCIILIFCSQKSMRICKTLRRKSIKIYTEIGYFSIACITIREIFQEGLYPWSEEWFAQAQTSEINIRKHSEETKGIRKLVRIEGYNVPVTKKIDENGEVELNFYLYEKFDGLKFLAEFFTRFFNSSIDEIQISSDEYPDQIRKTIDWILSKQESIPVSHIEDDQITDEHIRAVLNVSNFVNNFFISVKPTDSFTHQFIFNRDVLSITNAFWINLQNLFNVDCRLIQMEGTRLTSQEMNWYLRHWMNGAFPRVKVINIDMEEINLHSLLADLNAMVFPEGEERVYKLEGNEEYGMHYGFDITRNDGTVATIEHEGGDIVSKRFFFVVW
ncbi:hypothetical protein CAEBREN_03197 [Caenorhabditis brenneri]|uniref:Sdz-33 F-box domain-containing protein n=1 Tax=Caenorhabditis brenneri TaxID=135651 RepID=G0MDW8_CAEBE|nr:hypothetical protein CAEBREN_03197 [Caenorhabditis brenneri]